MSDRHFACNLEEIEPGTSLLVKGTSPGIALHRTETGELFATANICTHEEFSLGEEGEIEGDELVCPLHMARFDLRTGAALCLPATVPLATYTVEIDDEKVYVVAG